MNKDYVIDKFAISLIEQRADEVLDDNNRDEIIAFTQAHTNESFKFYSLYTEARYHYTLGNLHSAIHEKRNLEWYSKSLEKALICYKKTIYLIEGVKNITPLHLDLLSRTKTNLANYLVAQGRVLCGYNLWDFSIRTDGNQIAIMRMAFNELNLVDYLYDEGHKYHHYYYAYKLICHGIKGINQLHPSQKTAYEPNGVLLGFKEWFEENFDVSNFEKDLSYKEKTKTKSHRQYLEWVATNKLFLNDLNDIYNCDMVFQDVTSLPNMRQRVNESLTMHEELIYHSMFEEIKNEYCYARYLVFSTRNDDNQKKHFFNQTFSQVYCFDYPIEGLKGSNLKSAFKILYSIFDKIAYFLNSYFELENADDRVYFHNIFGRYKDGVLKPHSKLDKSENIFIHALFYILKDLRDTQAIDELSNESSYWLEPEIKKITEVRNALEHKSLTISDDFGYELYLNDKNNHDIAFDNLKQQLNEVIIEIKDMKAELKKPNTLPIDKEQIENLITEKQNLANSKNELINERENKRNLSLVISESEFTNLLFTLFRTIRNSIMYLVQSIEQDERKNKSDDVIYIQRDVPLKD